MLGLFQFLIGILKTEAFKDKLKSIIGFQFLIGILKTFTFLTG